MNVSHIVRVKWYEFKLVALLLLLLSPLLVARICIVILVSAEILYKVSLSVLLNGFHYFFLNIVKLWLDLITLHYGRLKLLQLMICTH